MKTQYEGNLKCATCQSETHFEYNEDRTYIKCTNCNREYLGGYGELLDLNQEAIDIVKKAIAKDVKKEFYDNMKDALKGNKFIKFK